MTASRLSLKDGREGTEGPDPGKDPTRRKAEEEVPGDCERRYRDLVEHASVGIYRATPEGRILTANPALAQMLGYSSPEELIASDIVGRHPGCPSGEYRDRMEREGAIRDADSTWSRRDGSLVAVRENAIAIRGPDGAIVHCDGTLEDVTERNRKEELVLSRYRRLAALRNAELTVTSNLDLRFTLNGLIEQAISALRADAADVLLYNPETQMLEFAAGKGFRTRATQETHLRLGEGHAGRAALERRIKSVPNLAEDPGQMAMAPLLATELFMYYCAVPLIARGEIKGVLEMFRRSHFEPDSEWEDFLDLLVGQADIAIDNAVMFERSQLAYVDLSVSYEATLESWVRALDARHAGSIAHTRSVTEVSLRLARSLGLSDRELAHCRRGALLHDIGESAVSNEVLLKAGPFSDEDRNVMRRHPIYAYEFLSSIPYLRPALDIPYCHHERWDGTGYPRGLKGEQIPLTARIFSVVDVWDAMLSERPHRCAWTEDEVRAYIESQSASSFDPGVVGAFFTLLDSGVDMTFVSPPSAPDLPIGERYPQWRL